MANTDSFFVLVKSDIGRNFVFFVSTKLEKTEPAKFNFDQFTFYWINDEKLVRVDNSNLRVFKSNDEKLIQIFGISIENDRTKNDAAMLLDAWKDSQHATDGYPHFDQMDW